MIAWVRKRRYIYGLGLLLVAAGVFLALTFDSRPEPETNTACIQLDVHSSAQQDTCIELEVVKTDRALSQGLSDRPHMPMGQGMLFDFGQEGYRCMWMKDMQFSLDMIWLNDTGEVVDVTTGVSPETYPEEKFCGQAPARYVIEVNAGVADSAGVSSGQQIQL